MAFDVTPGSGKTISADVYGAAAAPSSGQQTQWVGVATGTTGALAPVASANPLYVAHPSTDPAVVSLAILDDWDSTDACKTVGVADLIDVTLSLDTSAYSSGDLLADIQTVTSALRVSGGTAVLESLTVIDSDDQGVAFTVFLTTDNTTWGSENSAPSAADSVFLNVVAAVAVGTADYVDVGGAKIACVKNIGAVVKGSGSANLYVAVVNGSGTPTFSATGVKLRFGFKQN